GDSGRYHAEDSTRSIPEAINMSDPRQTPIEPKEAREDDRADSDQQQTFTRRILEALTHIAEGNLNIRLSGATAAPNEEDQQVLLNLDEMARRLRYIVGRLQRAADSIEGVVGEVLKGTQAVSIGVLDEARSVRSEERRVGKRGNVGE